MKKILGTSLFRIVIIVLFGLYLKLFDTPNAKIIAGILGGEKEKIVAETGSRLETGITSTLTAIDTQIDIVANKVSEMNKPNTETTTQTMVRLYYFNEQADKQLPIEQQANPNSLLPVIRTVPQTDNIIRDTLQLLLQGGLTDQEFRDGFTSDFVRSIRLVDAKLDSNGILSLSFEKAPGANIGGSAYIGILTNAIIKTALQFQQVQSVNLLPEELFQP